MTSHLSTSCLLCDITTLHYSALSSLEVSKWTRRNRSVSCDMYTVERPTWSQECFYCHVFQRDNRIAIISKFGQWAALYDMVDGINCNHCFAVKPMMLNLAANPPSTFSWRMQPTSLGLWCGRDPTTFGQRVASLAYVNDSSPCRC